MKKAAIIAVILISAFLTTYTIHLNYSLPFHSDEWDHLTLANEIVKTGQVESVRAYNPYLGQAYRVNRGPAYHLLVALLLIQTGLGVTTLGIILPTVVAFILGLGTYTLVKHITENEYAGLIAAVFALTIKSNVTVLGLWFMVPSAYGIAMAPMILYLFLRTLKSKKIVNSFDIVLGLILVHVAFSHPPSATVVFPVMAAYLIIHPRTIWDNRVKLVVFALVGLSLLVAELYIIDIPREDLLNPMKFINSHLKFTASDYEKNFQFHYFRFVGKFIIFLTAVGAYSMLSSDKRGESILPVALLALLPLVYQYYTTGEVYLTTYRRIFLYNVEILLILAGIGLYKLFEIVTRQIKKHVKDPQIKLIAHAITLILVLIITLGQIESTSEDSYRLYHVVEEKDISPILWLSDNTPENATIMALPNIAKAITPLTGRKVVGIVRTTLRSSDERTKEASEFFSVDCDTKMGLIEKYNVDYVFHNGQLGCPFLSEVHSERGDHIYQVT